MKITDFGISRAAGSATVTGTGELLGTPAYLAPERLAGQLATPASDPYSLGVLAWECLAGTPPFTGTPVEVALAHRNRPLPPLPAAVPADVAALVAELTARDPLARPRGAGEVARRACRLRDVMNSRATLPLEAQPDPLAGLVWAGPASPGTRVRGRTLPGGAAVLGAGGLTGAVVLAVLLAGASRKRDRHHRRRPTAPRQARAR